MNRIEKKSSHVVIDLDYCFMIEVVLSKLSDHGAFNIISNPTNHCKKMFNLFDKFCVYYSTLRQIKCFYTEVDPYLGV